VKCPQCIAEGRKDGELVEKKARRRGNIFYGCSNYPKCDFTSASRPVAEQCPECGSPYLLEKNLKAGTFLVCPNNKKTAAAEDEEQPKRKKKPSKAKAEAASETAPIVKCDFSKQVTKEPVAVA
jgi:DNA topoisomerase I